MNEENKTDFYLTFNRDLYRQGSPLIQSIGEGIQLQGVSDSSNQPSGYTNSVQEMTYGSLQSGDFLTGVRGWQIDANGDVEFGSGKFRGDISGATGTFTGTVSVGSLNIPDLVTADSFHVNTTGDAWWGATTIGASTAKILKTGIATFTDITITGGSIGGSATVGVGNLNVANQGWTQTSVFSVTDADTVAWGAGTFTSAGGTAYSISAGNTGNMVAKTYIYLDTTVSLTVYQTTTTASTAVGAGKVLVAVAQNATAEATYTVLSGQGGQNIDAASIVAGSITANEIAASTLTAGLLSVSQLSAISADLGAITAGTIVMPSGGLIRSGQTAFDTGTGFFVGNVSGTPKFSFGNSAGNKITWDGSALTIVGTLPDTQTFDSSGTWTMPTGTKYVQVISVGGGGGGGGNGATTNDTGGGGGGGGYFSTIFLASQITSPVTVTIPAAAAGGIGNNVGANGGTVTFGTYASGYGGGGGGKANNGSNPTGGGGGGNTGTGQVAQAIAGGVGGTGGGIAGGVGGDSTGPVQAGAGYFNGAGGGGEVGAGTGGAGYYGGGGGGGSDGDSGGTSKYGGGGGAAGLGTGGVSTFAGSGGDGGNQSNGVAGTAPGGGGGGSASGAGGLAHDGGAGAKGRIIVIST